MWSIEDPNQDRRLRSFEFIYLDERSLRERPTPHYPADNELPYVSWHAVLTKARDLLPRLAR